MIGITLTPYTEFEIIESSYALIWYTSQFTYFKSNSSFKFYFLVLANILIKFLPKYFVFLLFLMLYLL